MNRITIENLTHDAALDSEAMNAVTGGWGILRHIKRKADSAYRGVRRGIRTVRRGARKIIRNRGRNGGAKFVFGVIGFTSPATIMNSWLIS